MLLSYKKPVLASSTDSTFTTQALTDEDIRTYWSAKSGEAGEWVLLDLEGKKDIPVRLWVAPPTKMDASELTKEGYYATLGGAGARMEMPGCSLCMGNQAQIRKGSTAVSTSTRNFPNRLGIDTRVYLASAELSAIAALLGRLPTVAEYQEKVQAVNAKAADVYRYMNFDQIPAFVEVANTVEV